MALFCCLVLGPTALAQMGGFGGPSVMGRGGQAGRRGGLSVRLRGFVSANGFYDSGLTTLTREGVVGTGGATGVETRWGGYGSKSFRRAALGLDYQGDYRYYPNTNAYTGSSQNLSLTYGAQPFRRVHFDLSAVAGTTNRAFGGAAPGLGLGSSLGSNIGQLAVPLTSFFDVRTNFLGGSGSVTLVHSSRLTTNISGNGFTVRRRNRLPGANGVVGRADTSYRLSKRSSIGVDLSYYKFDYTNSFGDTNVIDPGLLYSMQLGRSFEFGLRVGVMRIESFGVKLVAFDPEIAALLGVGQTSEIFYVRSYQASGGAQVQRRFKRGSATGQFQVAPNPGNGLLYASRQMTLTMGGTWTASRRMSVNTAGGWTKLRSVTSLAGAYEQYFFGGGISYKINRSMEFTTRVDRRIAQLQTGRRIGLNSTRFMAGISFAPGDVPLQW